MLHSVFQLINKHHANKFVVVDSWADCQRYPVMDDDKINYY